MTPSQCQCLFLSSAIHSVLAASWTCTNTWGFNTLRPRQNGRHFTDDIFKCIFLNENASIAIKISLKFVPKGPINNIPALVQIMAWRRPGDKPLSEPMMVSLPMHICVTSPQWVNSLAPGRCGCKLKLKISNLYLEHFPQVHEEVYCPQVKMPHDLTDY